MNAVLAGCTRVVVTAALVCALSACGDSGTGPGPETITNGMIARIDGQSFTTANGGFATATAAQSTARLYTYSIFGTQAGTGSSVLLTIGNVETPGTYPIGVDMVTVFGATATLIQNGTFIAPNTGASGSVTITTLSADRIIGDFTFDALGSGSTPVTKQVRSGHFNLPLSRTSAFPNYPDNYGSTFSGTVGGAAYNAYAVIASAGTGLGMTVANTKYHFVFSRTPVPNQIGPITVGSAAGQMTIIVSDIADNASNRAVWTTTVAGSTGTFNITAISSTRLSGTLTASLPPSPGTKATSPLAISVNFSIGIEP